MTQYIQGGGFGINQPISYNPYNNQMPNNIINFGGGYNPYQQQQQQGYTFQALPQFNTNNYYDPYATSYSNRSNYYSPYGPDYNYNPQPQYGYPQYGYPQYGYPQYPYGYNQYSREAATQMMNRQKQSIEVQKILQRGLNNYYGITMTEDELDRMFNPMHPANRVSDERLEALRDFKEMQAIQEIQFSPQKHYFTDQLAAMYCIDAMNKARVPYDNHSLCQFLEDDLWRIQKQQWIDTHCKPNNGRDMSNTYDSAQYNELLNMHRSSNPYVNQLLDNSRYDNNLDDTEIGMQAVMERERRRREILSGKVPDFVSSPERQQARHEWTQQILNQIYGKESGKSV